MVNKNHKHADGFELLLKTQSEFDLPVGLEEKIMMQISSEVKTSKSVFRISPVIIIGFLASLFICLSILSSNYIFLTKYYNDVKLTLLLCIVIYTAYEFNNTVPNLIQYFLNRKTKLA